MFSKTTSANALDNIQHKLSSDYITFYTEILNQYKTKKSKPAKQISDALVRVKTAIQLIGRAKGGGTTSITRKELTRLFDLISMVGKDVTTISEMEKSNAALANRMSSVSDDFGVSTESLSVTRDELKSAISVHKKSEKRSLSSRMQEASPELYGLGKSIGGSLATGVLGPFAGLAGLAFSGAKGMYDAKRRRSLEARGAKLSKSVSSEAFDVGATAAEERQRLQYGGHPVYNYTSRNIGYDRSRATTRRRSGIVGAPDSVRRRVSSDDIDASFSDTKLATGIINPRERRTSTRKNTGDSEFYFWDKQAHRTSYLRNVLKALKTSSPSKSIGVDKKTYSDAMFYFWDKQASKASYPKKLIKTLQAIAIEGHTGVDKSGDGGSSGTSSFLAGTLLATQYKKMAGVFGKFSKALGAGALPLLKLTGAVGLATVSIMFMDKQIKKHFGSYSKLWDDFKNMDMASRTVIRANEDARGKTKTLESVYAEKSKGVLAKSGSVNIHPQLLVSQYGAGAVDVNELSMAETASMFQYMLAKKHSTEMKAAKAVEGKHFWQSSSKIIDEFYASDKAKPITDFMKLKAELEASGINTQDLAKADVKELALKLDDVIDAINNQKGNALPDVTPNVFPQDPLMDIINTGHLSVDIQP